MTEKDIERMRERIDILESRCRRFGNIINSVTVGMKGLNQLIDDGKLTTDDVKYLLKLPDYGSNDGYITSDMWGLFE